MSTQTMNTMIFENSDRGMASAAYSNDAEVLTYFDEIEIMADYDLGFAYLVNRMDKGAMSVFTRLINAESDDPLAMALKLASKYNG